MTGRDGPVALVLGARVLPDGTPAPALQRRVALGVALWQAGHVRAIVLSGGTRTHEVPEAEVMAEACRAAGVPREALLLERAAMTTEQNFLFSAPLIKALGVREVVVVTDRFHAARARLLGRRAGLIVTVESPCPEDVPPWRTARTWAQEMVKLGLCWALGAGR